MRRREFIALLGSASTVWPVAARAQQQPMPTIGILGSTSSQVQANFLRAFLQGLGEAGYVEGRNTTIIYRWADDQNEKLPALAADLVRLQVDVIVAAARHAGCACGKGRNSDDSYCVSVRIGPSRSWTCR